MGYTEVSRAWENLLEKMEEASNKKNLISLKAEEVKKIRSRPNH
tara:strand:+ start:330 stop:461 length:132 start_codon:yes stop_codon:yes gene_type:complete